MIDEGYVESIKYLIEEKYFEISKGDIEYALYKDRLEIVKYLFQMQYHSTDIHECVYEYYGGDALFVCDAINIYQYVTTTTNIEISWDYYNDFKEALYYRAFKILQYLSKIINISNINIKQYITHENIRVLNILNDLGYPFTYSHLKFASFEGSCNMVKYFISKDIIPDTSLLNHILPGNNITMIYIFLKFGVMPDAETYKIAKRYNLKDISSLLKSYT